MRKALGPAQRGLTRYDRVRLQRALQHAEDVRLYRRAQALLLVAEGRTLAEAAHVTGLSRPAVYFWLKRYVRLRRVEALRDEPRRGRPPVASCITPEDILRELSSPPSDLSYSSHTWTVALLATHLGRLYGCSIHPDTLRRRMRAMDLSWKRPRYVYSEKAPHLPQKKQRSSAD
ncbi:helix-turn-helix domain-containing protein [Archangium violaceum]|uniref:helix-turn-helix domain-containing protein n=1 Tax=Archangium violaceum TaxID=83451 RepID=UPI0019510A48|nr:helix-turn-helix domain-containing protein [Archangium violaceum]QRN92991.1 helix-turn-helix domain-containing protein [Archangium violaceum]